MLLALDTATRATGIALHDGERLLAEQVWHGRGYHTVELAPEVALVMRRVGVSAGNLTALAVAQGPGSYTGLRIGMAIAKGFALALQLPLFGIPTLDILAYAQPRRKEPLLAVIQAGRKRVAALWYKWGKRGWQPRGEPQNLTWSELVQAIERPTCICGELEGELRRMLAEQPNAIVASPAQCVRRPAILAELAWQQQRAGERPDAGELAPVYLGSLSGKVE